MLHEFDTGYYHGMFGFVGADKTLRGAKFLQGSFADQMNERSNPGSNGSPCRNCEFCCKECSFFITCGKPMYAKDYIKIRINGIGKDDPTVKVSYKGVTGTLKKLERTLTIEHGPCIKKESYALEILDEADGHLHTFESVDLGGVKFIGAVVTLCE